MEVAINTCFGGFGLSNAAFEWLIENKNWTVATGGDHKRANLYGTETGYFPRKLRSCQKEFRTNPDVIAVIKHLGARADSPHSEIKIVEIPDDIDWVIDECDGKETIREVHRTWS